MRVQETIVRGNVLEEVNNASGFNLHRNFAFACTSSLSPRIITWLELENQETGPRSTSKMHDISLV